MNKSFDIIEKNRKTKKLKLIILITTIVFFGTLPFYAKELEKTKLLAVLILFFLVLNIFTFIFFSGTKKTGILTFKSDYISLPGFNIKIKDIEKVHIVVNNYYFARADSPRSGIGNSASLSVKTNKIFIKTKDNTLSHSFQVKYSKEINVIKKISEKYKGERVNIIFTYRKKRLV